MKKWVDVPSWSEFQVTQNGDIRKSGKMLRPKQTKDGYLTVGLLSVHRAVLFTFVGQPKEGQETRHLNGIKTDNRLENLRWGTKAEAKRKRSP